jgi:prepilin-type N-terminal cleavage/methylation domain-containing protein/prepilin-type processing-associated H-X9-DG protein
MNHGKLPHDFVTRLLAEDTELDAAGFDEQRRKILARLVKAESKERGTRKFVLIVAAGALAVLLAIASFTAFSQAFHNPEAWPSWVAVTLALLVILVPITALLISSIYLFRYRRPLLSLRKEAYEQTLLALPREIAQLRDQVAHLQTELNKRGEPPPPPQSSSGFTMIELMVSVVILTILASLLFPTLNAAKSRARSAQCKNHLSQIGKALVMYESDFNYLPGAGDAGHSKPKQIPWAFVSTNSWVARLSLYVDNRATIFTCPEYKAPFFAPGVKADSFGYNAGGSASIYRHMEQNLGLGFGKSNFVASTSLASPADMAAIGDVQFPSSVWCNIVTPHEKPVGHLIPIPRRHGGGAHMLFADGHLEWARQQLWIARNPKARARWNSDHQPHPETW